MGICFHDVLLMRNARAAGASFDNVLTIGRQSLCLHPAEVDFFVSACGRTSAGAASLPPETFAFGTYAEPFLRACLGAGTVEALDYSDYDEAQHIHDMYEPVPEALVGTLQCCIRWWRARARSQFSGCGSQSDAHGKSWRARVHVNSG